MNMAQEALLEKQNGWDVGQDPRRMTREELMAAGHQPMSPLKALRLRCLDCCAGQPSEVRLCTAVACPSWPFRMRNNPWRTPSEGRRESGRRLAREYSSSHENRKSDLRASERVEAATTTLLAAKLSTAKTANNDDHKRQPTIAPEVTR